MQGIVVNFTYLTCKGSTESAHLYNFFSEILQCSLYNLESDKLCLLFKQFIYMATISIKVGFSAAVLAVSVKPCIVLICLQHENNDFVRFDIRSYY